MSESGTIKDPRQYDLFIWDVFTKAFLAADYADLERSVLALLANGTLVSFGGRPEAITSCEYDAAREFFSGVDTRTILFAPMQGLSVDYMLRSIDPMAMIAECGIQPVKLTQHGGPPKQTKAEWRRQVKWKK